MWCGLNMKACVLGERDTILPEWTDLLDWFACQKKSAHTRDDEPDLIDVVPRPAHKEHGAFMKPVLFS